VKQSNNNNKYRSLFC